jgi:GNAT superfamily N-acetyltransferase
VSIEIRPVPAAATHDLRQRVLRPHQSIKEMVYEGDALPSAGHFAAFDGDRIVGIASVSPESHGEVDGDGQWRLRGMATDDRVRGTGLGARLLEASIGHAKQAGGDVLWCNARTPAMRFYTRRGFELIGDEFTPAGIGPHRLMALRLRA